MQQKQKAHLTCTSSHTNCPFNVRCRPLLRLPSRIRGQRFPAALPSAGVHPFRRTLTRLLEARFPLLYIETFEEQRVLGEIRSAVAELEPSRALWHWTTTEGMRRSGGLTERNTREPAQMLQGIRRVVESAVFVCADLHAFLGDDGRPADPQVVRALRDLVRDFRSGEATRTVIVVAPILRIPAELQRDVTVVDFPLPTAVEIGELLDSMGADRTVVLNGTLRDRLATAAVGMTLIEAERAFTLAMVDGGIAESAVDVVLAGKAQAVRRSGGLELVRTDIRFEHVGGLANLEAWLLSRRDCWRAEAADYGVPAPKGVFLAGVSGCGKSSIAKATAGEWGLPLIRWDFGRVCDGSVGDRDVRATLSTVEGTAPCVLWVSGIDRMITGENGARTAVFGTFLAWLSEKTRPVFVIAIADRIDGLPQDLLCGSRFDQTFFVDLPNSAARESIWRIHLERRLTGPAAGLSLSPPLLHDLSEASEGFSGQQIEQCVVTGLLDAYSGRRPLAAADLIRAVEGTVAMSARSGDELTTWREWAKRHAVPAAPPVR
ncbi:AAA family ATPase [Nocardia otitidiscaviarum]|uniref:AAA family ATPase n=1 Tax=Nocardia otitidiscaviarum TaxID=1823 RepID=UPI00189402B0|nr:AAA family ATPase [Nocardia otitidiscaviarum]MBF6241840.1 AAA family ATPase [Nocardia otitidiscaviarum]